MNPAFRTPQLQVLKQVDINWLLARGVSTNAMVRPVAMMTALGRRTPDGCFESDDEGERWLAFEQDGDTVFWQPRLHLLCSLERRSFALGEDIVDNPGTYAFDCNLNVFDHPLDWLRASRDGIVVMDWRRVFDRLRDVPRVAISESLLPLYRRHMLPERRPELFVLPSRGRAAA
jgi:hypothetical protein